MQLRERLERGNVTLLDVCFGHGCNSLAAKKIVARGKSELHVTVLEMDSRVVDAAANDTQTFETDSFDRRKSLSDHELKMIHETSRGQPYSDPQGVWANKEIRRGRQE